MSSYLSVLNQPRRSFLLCVEDVVDLLSHHALADLNLLLVSHHRTRESDRIIPTLSVLKRAGSDPRPASSVEDIVNFINDVGGIDSKSTGPLPRISEQIVDRAKAVGFDYPSQLLPDNNSTPDGLFVSVLVHPISTNLVAFNDILSSIFQNATHIIRNSLNLLNDSMSRTLEDWHALFQQLNPPGQPLQSVDEAVLTFCGYVASEYKVPCHIFEFDLRDNKWSLDSRSPFNAEVESFLPLIDDLMKRPDSHKPLHGRQADKYYLFIPFVSARANTLIQYALVLLSKEPMAWYLPLNVVRFVDYYFNDALQKEKLRILADLNQETLRIPSQPPSYFASFSFHHQEEISNFARSAFRRILRISNAFAATLRLYEPGVRGLRLLVEELDPQLDKMGAGNRLEVIPLADRSRSLNARTFIESPNYQSRERFKKGDVYNRRFDAKSEICFNMRFKGSKVGTINFEYPMVRGYEPELEFLQAIVSAVENHLTLLLEFSDKHWLTRRAQYEQNVHEAENLIRTSNLSEHSKTEITEYLRRGLLVEQGVNRQLQDISIYFKSYLEKLVPCGTLHVNRCYHIDLPEPFITIDAYWLGLVEIILKNILDNFFTYCDPRRDSIIVRHRVGDRVNSDLILIKISGSLPFPKEVLRHGTFRPLPSPDILKHESKGLLLVGILTRQLGGVVEIANSIGSSRCSLLVKIPLYR